jgi:hypothetical protein
MTWCGRGSVASGFVGAVGAGAGQRDVGVAGSELLDVAWRGCWLVSRRRELGGGWWVVGWRRWSGGADEGLGLPRDVGCAGRG